MRWRRQAAGALIAAVVLATAVAAVGDFTYEPYAGVLARHVDGRGMVAYGALKKKPEDLNRFVEALGAVDPETYAAWNDKAKIAFWTNAYNALTLKAIIDHYPIKPGFWKSLAYPKNSIRQIDGVWDKITHEVMGRKMTLDRIEHGILRGRDKKLVEKYGRFYEPRIHVALVCAAMGCPPLRTEPYVGERLDKQLDDQARRFLSHPARFRIDRTGGKVHLSSIFKWFGDDFAKGYTPETGFDGHGKTEKAVLNFCAQYLSPEDAAYLRTGRYKIEYLDYDWSLNEQKD